MGLEFSFCNDYVLLQKATSQNYWTKMAQQEGFKLLVTGIPKEIPENNIQVSNTNILLNF